jgi:hypothetical protein
LKQTDRDLICSLVTTTTTTTTIIITAVIPAGGPLTGWRVLGPAASLLWCCTNRRRHNRCELQHDAAMQAASARCEVCNRQVGPTGFSSSSRCIVSFNPLQLEQRPRWLLLLLLRLDFPPFPGELEPPV